MVDSVSVRFKNASVSKKKKPLNIIVFAAECGNRLRVGVLVCVSALLSSGGNG